MAPFKNEPNLLAGPFARKGMGPKVQSAAPESKLPPPKAPGGLRVEHRIGVQAPPEVVWGIVYDLPRWQEWNPTYPQAAGQIRIGETLALKLAIPGEAVQEIRPKVLEWVPNEQLHWQLTLMGGFIKTLRYIEIVPLAEEACVVDNGEFFRGLMGPSLARRVGRSVRKGFEAMNEALKERAEAEWRALKG